MNIYIVRHGETAFNVGEPRIRGRRDVPLSELGIENAIKTGIELSSIPIEKIYYSKLSRAKDTAAKIKDHQPSAEFIEEPFLLDISFGDWEGKTADEAFSPEVKKKWFSNPHDVLIPNGETFYQVLDRLHRLFQRLRTQEEEKVVLVSHGAAINLIFVYLTGTHPSHYWNFYVDTCSISHVKLSREGRVSIVSFNSITHKKGTSD
ncbi:MAG: histidine phosphatase family protein [Candidatus Heimdallarchaeota archaeon]|nr:histidine phosphatase family protein [Candidatus Heimdallarchaeota archaeon]MCK4878091.1 histidine phosphatase family protein [Candidatus Heimdallarchaeota archaeon]